MSCPLCLVTALPFARLECGKEICRDCAESLQIDAEPFDCPFCGSEHSIIQLCDSSHNQPVNENQPASIPENNLNTPTHHPSDGTITTNEIAQTQPSPPSTTQNQPSHLIHQPVNQPSSLPPPQEQSFPQPSPQESSQQPTYSIPNPYISSNFIPPPHTIQFSEPLPLQQQPTQPPPIIPSFPSQHQQPSPSQPPYPSPSLPQFPQIPQPHSPPSSPSISFAPPPSDSLPPSSNTNIPPSYPFIDLPPYTPPPLQPQLPHLEPDAPPTYQPPQLIPPQHTSPQLPPKHSPSSPKPLPPKPTPPPKQPSPSSLPQRSPEEDLAYRYGQAFPIYTVPQPTRTSQSAPRPASKPTFVPTTYETPNHKVPTFAARTFETKQHPVPPSPHGGTVPLAVAEGQVVCTSAHFFNPKLPLHFLRPALTPERLRAKFFDWANSGILASSKFRDAVASQPLAFDDIHMIPFLWLQITFSCDGCIGYYERPLSSVVLLWDSTSPYRPLFMGEVPIAQGKLYRYDPHNPQAQTLAELDNPKFLAMITGLFKAEEVVLTKDVPRLLFEDSKDPLAVYNDFVRGKTAHLTAEYKKEAVTSLDRQRSCAVHVVDAKSSVRRVYVPFCFTRYVFEGKACPVLIHAVTGEVFGTRQKSVFGITWDAK